MSRHYPVYAVLLIASAIIYSCQSDDPISDPEPIYSTETYPGDDWVSASPAALQMDAAKLNEAMNYAFASGRETQGVVITRHGVVIAEQYADGRDQNTEATSWSTAKSFVSALVGIAIDQGHINSVDDPVSQYIAEWRDTDKDAITIRSLLEMRSGLSLRGAEDAARLYIAGGIDGDQVLVAIDRDVIEPQMMSWVYQNANSMLLGEIVARASGQPITTYVEEHLFSKIGMDADWWTDEKGHALTYCCIDATTRAFARFGLLYARDGSWRGEQVVSSDWVSTSTAEYEPGSNYALHWVSVPSLGLYATAGRHENNIYVIPEKDIVVVRNSIYNQQGSEKIRTGTNFHETFAPDSWDSQEFLQFIRDAIIE